MQHFIEHQNVNRFRRLLDTETDPVKRATIEKLLSEVEAKLSELDQRAASSSQDRRAFASEANRDRERT